MASVQRAGNARGEGSNTALVDVKRLSHVALNTPDVDAQAGFYRDLVGLEETLRDDGGRAYLRCNERHHSLVLIPSGEGGGLDHFALEVTGGDAGVEAAAGELAAAGVPFEEAPDVAGQGPSLRLRDPDGFSVELVGSMEKADPVYGPRAVQPIQQDHITLKSRDPGAAAAFYGRVLGFQVSDQLSDGSLVWMRCNPRHHSVAFVRDEDQATMHHFGFEVVDMAQMVHQAEHLRHNGHQLIWGPGRHGPGNNYFEYFFDLDGNSIEFASDMQIIYDPDYEPKVWDVEKLWADLWGSTPPREWL